MKKIFYLSAVILLVMSPLRVSAQNNALDFDGTDDYVDCGIMDLSFQSFGIEGWFKVDELPPSSGSYMYDDIFGIETGVDAALLRINGADNRLEFVMGWNSVTQVLRGNEIIQVGQWYHVAILFQHSVRRMYIVINGKIDASMTISGGDNNYSNNYFRIGGQSSVRSFDGLIDEVKVWRNIDRTEEEIRADMYKEIVGNETGLVAYYKLDETSGTNANDSQSSSTYDGTLTNMNEDEWTTSSAFFGPKNCLDFDGLEANVWCSSITPTVTSGSIEFWVNLDVIPTDNARLISRHSSYGYDEIYLLNNDGRIYTAGSFVVGDDLQSTNPLPTDVWTHVAITADGSGSRLYINGILDDTGGAADFDYNTFRFGGQYTAGYYEGIDGMMDEVRLWNDVRTESEIRENMFKSLVGDESNLVAYYNLDNRSGSIAQSYPTEAHDGSIGGGATWVTSTAFNTWLSTNSSTLLDPSNWSNGLSSGAANYGFHNWLSSSQLNISSALTLNNLYVGTGIGASGGIVSSGGFTIYSNLFINSPLSISSATEHLIYGDMIIGSGGELNSNTGAMVTIGGDLDNAGQVHLYSPSNMNTGSSLIVDGTTTNTGTMTLDRYITAGTLASDNYNWHMMSLPVASAQASNFYLNDYVYAFNENNTWDNLPLETDMVNRGQGYIVKTLSNKTVSYSGTFNSGDINVNVTSSSAGSSSQGFNLVGNPYPSAIDLEAIGRTGIGNTFWVWNGSAYLAYNVITHAGDRRYVQPGQGFFTWSDLASGTVGFTNASQVHYTDGTFLKKSDNSMDQMILKVSNGEYSDKLYINHTDVANDGFKLFSMNPGVPQLFVMDDFDVNFAIYNLQGELAGQEISLGFRSDLEETFSFEVSELMFDTYDIILRDELTSSEILLEEGSAISFSHSPDAADHRFTLIISTKSTIGIEDDADNWNWVYSENMNINVMTPGILNADISVMNLNGQIITQFKANSDRSIIPIPTEGLYFVKIVSNNQVSLKKIIVK